MRRTPGLGPFAGLNNRLPPSQLGTNMDDSDANYLAAATNVDVTNAGTLKRRSGYTRTLSGNYDSLWSPSDGETGYAKKGRWLLRLLPDGDAGKNGMAETALRGGLDPALPVSFAEWANGDIIWSNGVEIGRVRKGGSQSEAIWTAATNRQPDLIEVPGGGLPGGIYQVILTRVNAFGEQSPATEPVRIELHDNSSLTIRALPAKHIVYATPPNGDEFFKVGETSLASPEVSLYLPRDGGERCVTRKLALTPAGNRLAVSSGRLFSAKGSQLCYSEPFCPGLYNPASGYLLFPAPVTLLAPCGQGLFLASDKTYWITPDEQGGGIGIKEVLPYGAPEGNFAAMPDSLAVTWWSDRGQVMGTPDGEARCLTERQLAVPATLRAATLARESSGLKQTVSSTVSPQSVAGIRTFFEAELS